MHPPAAASLRRSPPRSLESGILQLPRLRSVGSWQWQHSTSRAPCRPQQTFACRRRRHRRRHPYHPRWCTAIYESHRVVVPAAVVAQAHRGAGGAAPRATGTPGGLVERAQRLRAELFARDKAKRRDGVGQRRTVTVAVVSCGSIDDPWLRLSMTSHRSLSLKMSGAHVDRKILLPRNATDIYLAQVVRSRRSFKTKGEIQRKTKRGRSTARN